MQLRRIAAMLLIALLVLPAAAGASGDDVLVDCADDQTLSRKYTQAEYKQALKNIPADLDEYTDCRSIIRKARLSSANGGSGDGSGGTPATPRHEISKRKRDQIGRDINSDLASASPLRVGNAVVDPNRLSTASAIPAPLIAVLVLAGLGLLGGAAIAIHRFVIDRRN